MMVQAAEWKYNLVYHFNSSLYQSAMFVLFTVLLFKHRVAPVNTQMKTTDVVVKDINMVQQRQQKPRTMDALFAGMKEERSMMVFSSQQQNSRQRFSGRQQQTRSGGFRSGAFSGHRFVNISDDNAR